MLTPVLFGADSWAWTAPADHSNTIATMARPRLISHLECRSFLVPVVGGARLPDGGRSHRILLPVHCNTHGSIFALLRYLECVSKVTRAFEMRYLELELCAEL